MRTQEEIDQYNADKIKKDNNQNNTRWLMKLNLQINEDNIYSEWLINFCKTHGEDDPSKFINDLYTSSEFQMYIKSKEIRLLGSIYAWILFWSIISLVSIGITIIYLISKTV